MTIDKNKVKSFFNLSFYVRLAVILLIIILAVFLYHYGKQHNIYVDNRTIEIDGVEYKAIEWAEVSVDGRDAKEYYPRTRQEEVVQRQKHSIHILYEDEDFNQFEVDAEFTIPLNEKEIVLSLPALVAGLGEDKYLVEFVPMAQQLGIDTGAAVEDTEITEADMFGDMTMDF